MLICTGTVVEREASPMTKKKKMQHGNKDSEIDPGRYLQAVEKTDRAEQSGSIDYVKLFKQRDSKKPH
jgi:hypothetical protein